MPELTLKKKVTLRKKNDSEKFTFSGCLKVKLFWKTYTDFDLCLFFKRKDGAIGGVFSSEYRNKRSDLGDLNKFPYMMLMGEIAYAPSGEDTEQIYIASLSEIDTAYITIINYGAAIEGEDVSFAEDHARIELQSDLGDCLEVLADSKEKGHICCVCSIHNNNGEFYAKNENQVMDLSTAFRKIPGFKLIVSE